MTAPLAYVTAEWPEVGHEGLVRLGYRIRTGGWGSTGDALDPEQLIAAAAGASVLVVEVERVDDQVLAALPDVEVVCTARGTPSNVDLAACSRRGIPVLNTPGRNADSVADYVIGLIIAGCRGISAGERHLRSTGWLVGGQVPYLHFRGPELGRMTLGLIGYGEIGQRVAARAERGFGMRVLHHDPFRTDDSGEGAVDLPTLLRTADVVSLHCTRSPQTVNLIDAAALALMKPTAYLVNTAGGGMVDEAALLAALDAGDLAGAALDVFATEPLPADSPLLRDDRLLLTPHLAGAADDVAAHHAEMICADLALLADGKDPAHCANLDAVRPVSAPRHLVALREETERLARHRLG
ncbi:MAG TPA: NAD(P)-dependent oxidoreductase [Micromonospora sp.]